MDEGETVVENLPEMTINQIILPEKSGNAIAEKVQEATQAAAKMVDRENAELEKMNEHDGVKTSGISQEGRIEEEEPEFDETEDPKTENEEIKMEEQQESKIKQDLELRTTEKMEELEAKENEETEDVVELKSKKEVAEDLEAEEENSESHSIEGEAAPKGGEWLNSETKKAEMNANGKELMELEKGTNGGEKKTGRRKDRKRKVVEVQDIEPVQKKMLVQKKEAEPTTPAIVRPHRERKSVERLVATFEKVAVKEFQIEKGHGTPLKDIPNVAFKLSKKKSGDAFKLLHRILFGKLAKASQMKSHIAQFSGFVWHEHEEKQRAKVKEKFDKFNKEKLSEFCDILDIPITKTTTKKEDIITKLMDFLDAPHPTTKVLLAEKEVNKSKKRKQVAKGSVSSGGSKSSAKKKDADSSKPTHEKSAIRAEDESEEKEEEEEEDDDDDNEEDDDERKERGEDSEEEEEKEGEEHENRVNEDSEREEKIKSDKEETRRLKRSRKTSSSSSSSHKEKEAPPPPQRAKTKETKVSGKQQPSLPKRAPTKPRQQADKKEEKETKPRVFSRRKKNNGVEKEDASAPSEETTGKKNPRGKEKKPHPSDEALKKAICDILLKVDFNTTTFSDIVKELAGVFNVDLTSRKSSIKFMIQEELAKVADEGDEDEGESENEESSRGDEEVEA